MTLPQDFFVFFFNHLGVVKEGDPATSLLFFGHLEAVISCLAKGGWLDHLFFFFSNILYIIFFYYYK
jgi:hypothetical protein